MAITENDPAAPGEQTAEAQSEAAPEQTQQAVETAAPAAIPVQRFNEVYAKQQEAERRAQQLEAQVAALIAVAGQQSQQHRAPAEPEFEVEPEFKQRTNVLLAPVMRQQQQLQAQFQEYIAQQEFNRQAASFEPDVVQAAINLQQAWRQNGYTGWKPEDSLIYAAGAKARQGHVNNQTAAQQAADFNQGGRTVARAPAATVPAAKAKTNYDALPLEQRLAAMDAEIDDFAL